MVAKNPMGLGLSSEDTIMVKRPPTNETTENTPGHGRDADKAVGSSGDAASSGIPYEDDSTQDTDMGDTSLQEAPPSEDVKMADASEGEPSKSSSSDENPLESHSREDYQGHWDDPASTSSRPDPPSNN